MHPIRKMIPAVFVPVQDLKRSTEWWSQLLDYPINHGENANISVFDFHGTGLLLDPNQHGFPYLTMIDAVDADAAHDYVLQQGCQVFVEPQKFPNVAFFNVFDDASNGVMLCWSPEREAGWPTHARNPESDEHPIRQHITRVFTNTDDTIRTLNWYRRLFGDATVTNGQYPYLSMDGGADVYVLNHQENPCPSTFFERINQAVSVAPLCAFEARDIEQAIAFLRAKGVDIVHGVQSFAGRQAFFFQDIDGNIFACEQQLS